MLYDADCGICSWCATALDRVDRHHVLRLLPLHLAAAELRDAPPEHVLRDQMHVRDDAGRWDRGGRAIIRIAGLVPILRPLAVAARFPPVRWTVEAWYSIVAGNRDRLGCLLGLDRCTYRGR
ncbi:MAG: thiol-disulfide oxidoreductase DCC family protein [Candidatus Limnocylindria bacterium]